jgi:hypothetical protein
VPASLILTRLQPGDVPSLGSKPFQGVWSSELPIEMLKKMSAIIVNLRKTVETVISISFELSPRSSPVRMREGREECTIG